MGPKTYSNYSGLYITGLGIDWIKVRGWVCGVLPSRKRTPATDTTPKDAKLPCIVLLGFRV